MRILDLVKPALDFLLGGPVRKAAKPLPEMLTLPIIFANGRDDDTEGLKAYLENRPVIFRGCIIPPGDYHLDASLRLHVSSVWLVADGKLIGVVGVNVPGWPVMTAAIGHGCHRIVSGEEFSFCCAVMP